MWGDVHHGHVVLSHLASLSTDISSEQLAKDGEETGQLMFSEEGSYHPWREINYDNQTSLLACWFSMDGCVLMDVDT
jgi:hypothetical protein